MTNPIKATTCTEPRISQGDIIRDVEYIELVSEEAGKLTIDKVRFPLVVVLTQDCDLLWDYRLRWAEPKPSNQDKKLFSVLVAPMYNAEHVYSGEQLTELRMKMQTFNRDGTQGQFLRNNSNPRFHYLEFDAGIQVVPSVVDFKHYFSVNVEYLKEIKNSNFVCQLPTLFREDICQRFSSFLSRIALPD